MSEEEKSGNVVLEEFLTPGKGRARTTSSVERSLRRIPTFDPNPKIRFSGGLSTNARAAQWLRQFRSCWHYSISKADHLLRDLSASKIDSYRTRRRVSEGPTSDD